MVDPVDVMTVDQILVLPFLRTRIHQPPPTKGIGKDECFKVIVPPFGQDNVCRVSRLIARTDYVTHLIRFAPPYSDPFLPQSALVVSSFALSPIYRYILIVNDVKQEGIYRLGYYN